MHLCPERRVLNIHTGYWTTHTQVGSRLRIRTSKREAYMYHLGFDAGLVYPWNREHMGSTRVFSQQHIKVPFNFNVPLNLNVPSGAFLITAFFHVKPLLTAHRRRKVTRAVPRNRAREPWSFSACTSRLRVTRTRSYRLRHMAIFWSPLSWAISGFGHSNHLMRNQEVLPCCGQSRVLGNRF